MEQIHLPFAPLCLLFAMLKQAAILFGGLSFWCKAVVVVVVVLNLVLPDTPQPRRVRHRR